MTTKMTNITYLHKGKAFKSLVELTGHLFCITCTQSKGNCWCYMSHMDKQQLDDVVVKPKFGEADFEWEARLHTDIDSEEELRASAEEDLRYVQMIQGEWKRGKGTIATYVHVKDSCIKCGGSLIGDNYTVPLHCEYVDDYDGMEADAGPIYCNFEEV